MSSEEKQITESDIEILLEDAFRKQSNRENIIIKEFLPLVGGEIRVEFQAEDDNLIYKNNRIIIKEDNTFKIELCERFDGGDVWAEIKKRLQELIEKKSLL